MTPKPDQKFVCWDIRYRQPAKGGPFLCTSVDSMSVHGKDTSGWDRIFNRAGWIFARGLSAEKAATA